MKRIALVALVLAAGCSNKKPEERKLNEAPAPAAPAPAAPGTAPAPAGSAAAPAGGSAAPAEAPGSAAAPGAPSAPGASSTTGFAPFDASVAGTSPWVPAADKGGVVELSAVDDASGKTQGAFFVERRCGAAALTAVEAAGKKMADRAKTGHAPVKCTEAAGTTSCTQPGLAEHDVALTIQYAKRGADWSPIGVQTYAMGVKMDKETAKYDQLLKDTCK